MKLEPNAISLDARAGAFVFTARPRKFEKAEIIPYGWPRGMANANDYISGWKELADQTLADLRLSKATVDFIASHVSRRDGTCRMTDRAMSVRTGRSIASTKRDIHRMKMLGFICATYEPGDGVQERVRVLKIVLPKYPRSDQRIPPRNSDVVGSTYPPYVDPLDKGERRDD